MKIKESLEVIHDCSQSARGELRHLSRRATQRRRNATVEQEHFPAAAAAILTVTSEQC